MSLGGRIVAVLVLGAWAVAFAQADARPRAGKHPENAAGHAGTHQAAPKPLRNAAPVVPGRNAIGATTPSAGVGFAAAPHSTGSAPGVGAVKPNAIGAHAGTPALSPPVTPGAGKIGSTTNPATAVRAVPYVPPARAGGINGTGMARTNGTAGTIGGPARIAGGISGTGMQKKK